jgi:hypothetical protein
MDISAILAFQFPNSFESIDAAYDGVEDLQAFLDDHVTWKGAPIPAAAIQGAENGYLAHVAAMQKPDNERRYDREITGNPLVLAMIEELETSNPGLADRIKARL